MLSTVHSAIIESPPLIPGANPGQQHPQPPPPAPPANSRSQHEVGSRRRPTTHLRGNSFFGPPLLMRGTQASPRSSVSSSDSYLLSMRAVARTCPQPTSPSASLARSSSVPKLRTSKEQAHEPQSHEPHAHQPQAHEPPHEPHAYESQAQPSPHRSNLTATSISSSTIFLDKLKLPPPASSEPAKLTDGLRMERSARVTTGSPPPSPTRLARPPKSQLVCPQSFDEGPTATTLNIPPRLNPREAIKRIETAWIRYGERLTSDFKQLILSIAVIRGESAITIQRCWRGHRVRKFVYDEVCRTRMVYWEPSMANQDEAILECYTVVVRGGFTVPPWKIATSLKYCPQRKIFIAYLKVSDGTYPCKFTVNGEQKTCQWLYPTVLDRDGMENSAVTLAEHPRRQWWLRRFRGKQVAASDVAQTSTISSQDSSSGSSTSS